MNILTDLAKITQFISKGSSIINDVDHLIRAGRFSYGKTASLTTRTILISLTFLELSNILSQQPVPSSSERTMKYKHIELGFAVANAIFEGMEAKEILDDPDTNFIEVGNAFERKLLAPIFTVTRVIYECELLKQKKYREMSPEEQANLLLPRYKYHNKKDNLEVEYVPFDLKECLEAIKNLEDQVLPRANWLEAALTFGLMFRVIIPTFNQLVVEIFARIFALPPLPSTGEAAPTAHPRESKEDDDQDIFDPESEALEELCNLRRLNAIPLALEQDEVLKQFTCSITQRPIRYIVADPTDDRKHFYERDAIKAWLSRKTTSPMTRQILTISMLKPCTHLQMIIDERLDFYSQTIRRKIEKMKNMNIDQAKIEEAIKKDQTS